MQSLVNVYLHSNQLTGTLPTTMHALQHLGK